MLTKKIKNSTILCYLFFKVLYTARAIAFDNNGGTAFPICNNCHFFVPSKIKSSGKLCNAANSLGVKTRGNFGCIFTPPWFSLIVHEVLFHGDFFHASE